MKNLKHIVLGIASFLVFSLTGIQAQVTATGHIFAEVIDALGAGESTPMNFGRFSAGDRGGSITINPTGSVMAISNGIAADGNINPATFAVSGSKDAAFAVTLPDGPTTLMNLNGNTMLVTDWNASAGDGTEGYVLAGGMQQVKIGATLKVGSNEENPTGIYTGSYRVTFAYN